VRSDSELRSEFRSALEAVTPAAPWLVHDVKKGLGTRPPNRRSYRAPVQLRFGLNVIALLVLIGFAVAAVGVYLTIHQAPVPARPVVRPIVGRVFFPTEMVTATTGWSWVDPSELWRTTDGGAHWTNVSPPPLPDRMPTYTDTPYLLDANDAWIAESGQGGTASAAPYITTFRTIDGGKTWQEGASVPGLSPKLFFIDQSHGWLLLSPQGSSATDSAAMLYSTDDAGLHWTIKSSATVTVGIESMIFSSLTTGWITGVGGILLVTHDAGVTWQIQRLPVTPTAVSTISMLQFFDPQHGIAYWSPSWTDSGSLPPMELLVTSDGGTTWVVRLIPGERRVQWEGSFVDPNHGWVIAGSAGEFQAVPAVSLPLYKTDDGGLTWVRVPTKVVWHSGFNDVGPIDIVRFVDRNNGFAVREKDMTYSHVQWLKTTDGGLTWTVMVEAPKTP
jgi:photosystem II stability/assembly factor-like uncharacterized protein